MESKIEQFYKSEEKIAQKYFQTLRLAFPWIRFNLLFAKQALSHIQYVQEQTVIGHNHRNNAWHLQSLTHLFRWLLSLQGNCGNLAQFLPAIGWTCTDYCDCAITNARRDSAALLYEWCWLIFCPIQILAVAANNIQVGTSTFIHPGEVTRTVATKSRMWQSGWDLLFLLWKSCTLPYDAVVTGWSGPGVN